MPTQSRKRRAPTTTVALRAREIADTGDRWFLSVAGGLGRAGEWAKREADIAADSAVSAFATTVHVAKALVGVRATDAVEGPARGGEAGAVAAQNVGAGEEEPPQERRATIDVMAAMPAAAWAHSVVRKEWSGSPGGGARPEPSSKASDRNPAGVVPVLQALGRTVADHTRGGYATLQRDERFWTLIHLLQVLGRPNMPTGLESDSDPASDVPGESEPVSEVERREPDLLRQREPRRES